MTAAACGHRIGYDFEWLTPPTGNDIQWRMATSGRLIEGVAKICGLPAVNVGTHYKALREAGLTSKSGRGLSAARMTVRDAANLLIALTSGALAKDVADEVRRIRGFRRRSAVGLRVTALEGRIGGDDFGAFFEDLLTLELEGRLQDVFISIPTELFPKSAEIAKWWRSQGLSLTSKAEREAELETSFYIDFTIDDDTIEVIIERRYLGRDNDLDGALFMADEPLVNRTPGIVTSKKLLAWAIRHIVALLTEGPVFKEAD